MSGHSKWNNIKRKKEATDAKKASIFTKIGREMAVAIKEGGSDPNSNSKLRDIIAKAKANNVPNDNIKRMIEKYSSSSEGADYETIVYEGYGPSGIAVIAETMTDNRNRTAAEMRHYFDKYGKGLGATGCVSWQFERKGVLAVEQEDRDEDEFMMTALDAGADDVMLSDDVFEILTTPDDFSKVREALEGQGISFLEADIQMVPSKTVKLENEEDIKNMEKLIDMLESNDDVQEVFHNWEDAE
ncbi:MAG: YebC/PmpR family DNA-binding transcriptional regulator [Clostridiales bacterium]|nr:YebC/PmpR family DNA-binding transcriptional regulator [Clostridiales bacterium]